MTTAQLLQCVERMTNNIWHQYGEMFMPGNTALNCKSLPPAIYRFGISQQGWYLEKTASRYAFPFKVYGTNNEIVGRVRRAWHALSTNFGVLLNGLKGTGKTVTAQQIVNWAIDEGLIILNVPDPVPLSDILVKVEQPMLILFDEFEKTHDEEAQQKLLSAVDGLSRSDHRRLFLFTTNVRSVNSNFIDRPSRIRYCWEFSRVNDDLVEMLLDDLLDPNLAHLRPEIRSYLSTRDVLTIDAVKTAINECNIFQEAPEAFKDFMNLTERTPSGFKVEIVSEGGATEEIAPYFNGSNNAWVHNLMTKAGRRTFIDDRCAQGKTSTVCSYAGQYIEVVGPTDNPNEWVCHVQVPVHKTWVGLNLEREANKFLWLDAQPQDWRVPEWARKIERSADLTDEEQEAFDDWQNSTSVYGGASKARRKVRVRFTADTTPFTYKYDGMGE